jgi:hypothetical protein
MAQRTKTNGLAIASLICALFGAGIGSIPALIFGYRARKQIRASDGAERGEGLAVAGITLGWIQVAVIVGIGIAALILATPTPGEKALHAAENASKSWANAEFAYFSAHGRFTTDESALRELGGQTVSSTDDINARQATSSTFCVDGTFHYVDDHGREVALLVANYRLADDAPGRYWQVKGASCDDLMSAGRFP